MTIPERLPGTVDPASAASMVADLGFLSCPDLPDRPGPAAFLADTMTRYRTSPGLRTLHPDPWVLLQAEEGRLRSTQPREWLAGEALWRAAFS